MAYEVRLDVFAGPLDLLLHLIKKHEIDIADIPIALIAEQYLAALDRMRSLNLDLAGEYLVMAATLLHIKSRMLLPAAGEDEAPEEEDPRADLVRQLLEYQSFKEAALELGQRRLLDRDVFKRTSPVSVDPSPPEEDLVEMDLFDLVEAFRRLAAVRSQEALAINGETMSLADCIHEILGRLEAERSVTFSDLAGEEGGKRRLIFTLLAILELMKLRMVRAYQSAPFGAIRIFLAVEG